MSVHELPAPRFLTFEVSGRPRGKGRPRVVRVNGRSRTYTPKVTQKFESDVGWMATAALSLNENRGWPVNGKYELRVSYRMADNRSVPDEDNVLKAVQDGLEGILYLNDGQVRDGGAKREPNGAPRTLVTIRVLDDAALKRRRVAIRPGAEAETAMGHVVVHFCQCRINGEWTDEDTQEFWRELTSRVEVFVD